MSDILDELLLQAAEAKRPPPPPPQGIPRPWVPRWIRQPIKWFLLPFVLIDLQMQRLARKLIRPPFKQEGKCKKRGNCCHYVLIRYSRSFIGRLFYFWYTQFLGFYPRLQEPQEYEGKLMHVMGCRYLREDGSCSQYHLRPLVCRQWPVIEHFGYPSILKGCGYRSNPPYPEETSDVLDSEGDPRLKVL
ncbi:MAG: YkgJ family cysteine cluster protein [Chlamydiia bacterium]|nr:YkgJ family cysteine cluster protein [Chlamydiia bacterium]